MKTNPATFREAARQCREEAALVSPETKSGAAHRAHLRLLARRFDNEAKAAEEADARSASMRTKLPAKWRALAMRATDIRALPGVAPESVALYQCAADLEAAEEAEGET